MINEKYMPKEARDFSANLPEASALPESREAAELAVNAARVLKDFFQLKPEERLAVISGLSSDRGVVEILKQASESLNIPFEELVLDPKTKSKEIADLFKRNQAVMDVSLESANHPAAEKIWDADFLEKAGSRLAYNPGLDLEMFRAGGALTESGEDLKFRLDKMEAVLKEAAGFKITSAYGTDLAVKLRPARERRWYKDNGIISRPGQWDNMPGGEIFTTPDQHQVNGVLVLPTVDLYTESTTQGVDEFVRLTFKDGIVTEIQGGQSAEILKEQLLKAAKEQLADGKKKKRYYEGRLKKLAGKKDEEKKAQSIIKKANEIIAEAHNPYNVLRVAEIAFGANSRARSVIDENGNFSQHGVPTIEKEKRLGTMHLALGSSKHGEEGVEGFYEAVSHLDFVLPRNGLTVEMFRNDGDFKRNKNGRAIIDRGQLKFFE